MLPPVRIIAGLSIAVAVSSLSIDTTSKGMVERAMADLAKDPAYGAMAEVIFGQSRVATEVDKVRTPLVEAGYAADQKEGGRLQWLTTVCMLVNRNPSIEAFSAQLLLTVHELLADIPGAAHMTGRWALLRLLRRGDGTSPPGRS